MGLTLQLRKNILWNAFGNMVYVGCQWIVTILVTRLFGYEDAGILSLAMSISALFQTVALFGIRNYQVSDIEQKYSDSTYVGFRGICCIFAMVICIVFSVFNRYSTRQIQVIFWFMLFRLAENYSDVLHGIAQKKERLDVAGKAFAIKGCEVILAFFLGYYASKDLIYALALMAIGSCIITATYDLFYVRKLSAFKMMDKLEYCFMLGRETVPLCIYMFLISAISTIPKYILEKMCDAVALGAYSSIFAPALLIQAVAGYVYSPFATLFAECYLSGDNKRFLKLVRKICLFFFGFAVGILIAGKVFGRCALWLLFGETILEYTGLLFPILIGIVGLSYLAFFCMLGVVIRDFKNLILGCLIGVFLCAVLTPVAIKSFGINGASYGLIAGASGAAVYIFICLHHRLRGRECSKNCLDMGKGEKSK